MKYLSDSKLICVVSPGDGVVRERKHILADVLARALPTLGLEFCDDILAT